MSVRQPDFAGSWYPADEKECQKAFAQLEEVVVAPREDRSLVGGIVPHAGWLFSGHIAYMVIRALSRVLPEKDTIILFGGHLGPSSSSSILTCGDFWTPLGPIALDEELTGALTARFKLVEETPQRHSRDNTTELQAPMIKHFFPNARMVVLQASPAPGLLELVEALVDEGQRLGRRMAVIGSTDLTHYGPNYGWAPKSRGRAAEDWVRKENDPRMIELICRMEVESIIPEAHERSNACCPGAVVAAVHAARRLGARTAEVLQYGTSLDVHPSDSFVGYVGIVL